MPIEPSLSKLLAPAQRERGDLYAVLDGARDEAIHAYTRGVDGPWMYLQDNIEEASYQICAPRVVGLEFWPEDRLERFIEDAWGNSWGVFVRTHVELWTLRRHLRSLTTARLPDGRIAQFRFYDPRVLRSYLPTCASDELAALFGPITEYAMEGEDPAIALRYVFADRRLDSERLELQADTGC